ncbi:MAG: hypothetical protein JXX29_06060 [Deltaproteobacteria bacterium]|nr:hypothetical protein [Deltaproteobacteria bacterium]MBN2671214.1 hypothetical protein [Deltaproteobacteria bacterium]
MQQRKMFFGIMMVLVLSMGTTVSAQSEDLEKAQEIYRKAVEAFSQKTYEDALAQFKEAYNLSQKPAILYNLAVCHEKLKQTDHAIAYYELYLEEVPEAEDAAFVKQKVAWLKDPENNPPPAVEKESTEEANAPDEETIPAPVAETRTEPDQPLTVVAPVDPNVRQKRIIQGLLIGVGSLVFATGGLTAIAAYKKYDGYETVCAPDCSDDQVTKVRRLSIAADIQMGVGLAALTTGVVWMILDRKKERLRDVGVSAWRLHPFVSPIASGIGVGRRF